MGSVLLLGNSTPAETDESTFTVQGRVVRADVPTGEL